MAKKNKDHGLTTAEIAERMDKAEVEAVNMTGALNPADREKLLEEDQAKLAAASEVLRKNFNEDNLQEPEGVVLSTEGPQVAPYVTSKSIMEKPKASLPLAERFKHLSEAELLLVAQSNSWDNEFTLTVLENRRRETSEVDHAPYCPSEVEIVVDEGHTI